MIAIVAARSKNNVIGKAVVMGRKSYEEMGHPLEDYMNIVVSKTQEYRVNNLITVGLGCVLLRRRGAKTCLLLAEVVCSKRLFL